MLYYYISYSVWFGAFTVCVYSEVISRVQMDLVSNVSETGLVIRGWCDKRHIWILFQCLWMSQGTPLTEWKVGGVRQSVACCSISASDCRDKHSLQNAKHEFRIDMADHQIKLHCISVTYFYTVELHKTSAILLKVRFISERQVVWWGIRSNSCMEFS